MFNNLKQDAEKTLSVLLHQPEVNITEKVTLIGPLLSKKENT